MAQVSYVQGAFWLMMIWGYAAVVSNMFGLSPNTAQEVKLH